MMEQAGIDKEWILRRRGKYAQEHKKKKKKKNPLKTDALSYRPSNGHLKP